MIFNIQQATHTIKAVPWKKIHY